MQQTIAKPSNRRMGRPRKTGGRKTTFWIEDINSEMLRIFAERNAIDMTSALNLLLRQNLSAIGLMDEAQKRVGERKDEQGDSDD